MWPFPLSRLRPALLRAALAAATMATVPAAAAAQAVPRAMDGVRIGITVGGTGLVGLSVEWVDEALWGVEASLATFAFHDVSVGLGARHYFGGAYLRPVVGAGLWLSHSFSRESPGSALLVRAPLGMDWRASGEQFVGVTVSANRVLWMTRPAPDLDVVPSTGRLVPVPELAWRWRP